MAQPDFVATPAIRVVAPKPRMTIYSALLIIALIAMLVACLFLYLEIRRHGGFGSVQGRVSSVDRATPTVAAEMNRDGGSSLACRGFRLASA
jgi:hypothetical protein